MSNSSFFANWKGLSFEMVCLKHDKQIKKALGISGVSTEISSWRCSSDDSLNIKGHQIDLIISRKDNVINLCEMKYSTNLFEIDKKYAEELESRVRDFITVTGTKNAVHLTMITTYGIKPNNYSSQINEVLCLDSLFE